MKTKVSLKNLRFALAGFFLGIGIEHIQMLTSGLEARLQQRHSRWFLLETVVPAVELLTAVGLFRNMRAIIVIAITYLVLSTVAIVPDLYTNITYDASSLIYHQVGPSNDWFSLLSMFIQFATN